VHASKLLLSLATFYDRRSTGDFVRHRNQLETTATLDETFFYGLNPAESRLELPSL
jgi:hypothetical protein